MKILFEWKGKHISLNDWYRSKHWKHRKQAADDWHKFFGTLLLINRKQLPKEIKQYKLHLIYMSKLDPSNTITMIKLFEDAMQKMNIVKDDSMFYCKGLTITPDASMDKMEYRLELEIIG